MSTHPLRAYRAAQSLTLEQLADVFRVHKTTVMRWEDRQVPAERVLDIECRTGVSRHDLRPDIYPRSDPPRRIVSR